MSRTRQALRAVVRETAFATVQLIVSDDGPRQYGIDSDCVQRLQRLAESIAEHVSETVDDPGYVFGDEDALVLLEALSDLALLMGSDERYLIYSYEHQGWWRPHWCGYTRDIEEAGEYPPEESLRIVKTANRGAAAGDPNEEMIPARLARAVMELERRNAAEDLLDRSVK